MPSLYQRFREWQRSPHSPYSRSRLARTRSAREPAAPFEQRREPASEIRALFFDRSPLANFVAEPSGRVLACNTAFASLFQPNGHAPEEPYDMRALCAEPSAWDQLLKGLGTGRVRNTRVLTLRTGAERRREDAVAALWGEGGPQGSLTRVHGTLFTGQVHRELTSLFEKDARLEFVTRTAGQLAHDFNNLLTIILSVTELVLMSGGLAPPMARRLRSVVSASQRAASLTTQLLSLSRKPPAQLPVTPVNDLVQEALGLLRRLTPELDLHVYVAHHAGAVQADVAQLGQVLVNLVIHMRDILPPHASLCIFARRVRLDEKQTRALGLVYGDYVQIRIAEALPFEHLTEEVEAPQVRLHEEASRPSGLGLTSAWGIVQHAGGHLEFTRPNEEPPSFAVYLPVVAEERRERKARPPQAAAREEMQAHTILVAEDEELVRQLTSLLLRELGYTVLEAPDGVAALEVAKRHGGAIHLLLTDVTMPRMGGVQLAHEMRAMFPNIQVLYMSGHSEETLLRHGLTKRESRLLAKPFTQATLASAVRSLLSERPQDASHPAP